MTEGLLNRETPTSNTNDFDEINRLIKDCIISIFFNLKSIIKIKKLSE